MNVVEELKSLDVNDVGRWPLLFRAAVIVIVFIAVLGLGIWFTIVKDQAPAVAFVCNRTKRDSARYVSRTSNVRPPTTIEYKAQLAQIEQSFGTMLRQLPGETEIPSLIVDVSQTGLAAGLQEKLFQPQPEIPRDFYAEKPIKIRLSGGYHEIANFVSGVAALPRIVTLHDINITPEGNDSFDQLSLEVTAQTYRYLDEEAGL